MDELIKILPETSYWKSRPIRYYSGKLCLIKELLPEFELRDFVDAENSSANPYYKSVVRIPLKSIEKTIPIGIVSPRYNLVQHKEVLQLATSVLQERRYNLDDIEYEVGLSELGEWMNLRIYFPEDHNLIPLDKHPLKPRLEFFNTVEGSKSLSVQMFWYRLVCSNGMVVGNKSKERMDIHNQSLDLDRFREQIHQILDESNKDKVKIQYWQNQLVDIPLITNWVDTKLSEQWGKLAACRTYHICTSGYDVEYLDKYVRAKPSEKKVIKVKKVPGTPETSKHAYDVCQVLFWLASNRKNANERLAWQRQVPQLITSLTK